MNNGTGEQMTGNKTSTGPKIISSFVANLPSTPGVYHMLNAHGHVIYVGKARNLKARVSNYTSYENNPVRICRMISTTASMEFVHTNTEAQALLLEANMIKRLKPRYNVLLRDDKTFPYILIATDHPAPRLVKHRGAKRIKGHYFGPFASPAAVERTLAALQKAFLLRNCSNSYYAGRSRPCLQYQIKRCAAPCTGKINKKNYLKLVEDARLFLSGSTNSIQKSLLADMEEAAQKLDFERAAMLRDRLSALALIQGHGEISAKTIKEADIFAIHQQAGQFCIQVFFFRAHQNWGNHPFYPRADNSLSEEEVLAPFIVQFYENRTPPKQILLSNPIRDQQLIEDALSSRAGKKIKIIIPKRGEKFDLVSHASMNAREALGRQISRTASQKKLLQGVAKAFDMNTPPKRIEVYDNSHISGSNAVGAMIVSGPEGLSKKHYRTFNIKSTELTPGDDFAMMKEVLTRRFSRLMKENPFEFSSDSKDGKTLPASDNELPKWPDLVLIDGGKGQLSAACEIFEKLDMKAPIKLVAIAKGVDRNAGRETFHVPGKKPFMLPARDPILYFVQRLRDEAHRFVIGSHRARRKKQFVKNPLDAIEGIGPAKKRALLNRFGSAKAVSRAAISDIADVEGISKHLATRIYDHFNPAN